MRGQLLFVSVAWTVALVFGAYMTFDKGSIYGAFFVIYGLGGFATYVASKNKMTQTKKNEKEKDEK